MENHFLGYASELCKKVFFYNFMVSASGSVVEKRILIHETDPPPCF